MLRHRQINGIALKEEALRTLISSYWATLLLSFLLCCYQFTSTNRKDIRRVWVRTNNRIILGVTIMAGLQITIHNTTNDALVAHKCNAITGPVVSVDMGSFNADEVIDKVLLPLIGSLSVR